MTLEASQGCLELALKVVSVPTFDVKQTEIERNSCFDGIYNPFFLFLGLRDHVTAEYTYQVQRWHSATSSSRATFGMLLRVLSGGGQGRVWIASFTASQPRRLRPVHDTPVAEGTDGRGLKHNGSVPTP